jgi:hypothetical protein
MTSFICIAERLGGPPAAVPPELPRSRAARGPQPDQAAEPAAAPPELPRSRAARRPQPDQAA